MYRLHNLGFKKRIDWLVVNGKLRDKKLVISPWTDESVDMYNYLIQKWGIDNEIIIVDDGMSQNNHKVITMSELKKICIDDTYVALLNSVWSDFWAEFEESGIPYENIYVINGDALLSQDALIKCGEDPSIHTVLDVGCGKGNHSNIFLHYGKKVTGIDSGFACRIRDNYNFSFIQDEFMDHDFSGQYDLVWCSHVLEHQLAVGDFIKKLFSCCKPDGRVAITVPNEKEVVEGHVNNWNAGLLMYNIIQCGFSCENAAVKTYAYNVSVIVPKEEIEKKEDYRAVLNSRQYFPKKMKCGKNIYGGICFDGYIEELNWD